jgi:hypothetical protein
MTDPTPDLRLAYARIREEDIARAMFEADPAVGVTWDDWCEYARQHPTFQESVAFVRRQAAAVATHLIGLEAFASRVPFEDEEALR